MGLNEGLPWYLKLPLGASILHGSSPFHAAIKTSLSSPGTCSSSVGTPWWLHWDHGPLGPAMPALQLHEVTLKPSGPLQTATLPQKFWSKANAPGKSPCWSYSPKVYPAYHHLTPHTLVWEEKQQGNQSRILNLGKRSENNAYQRRGRIKDTDYIFSTTIFHSHW